MSTLQMLDVAIGMTFAFLLISLICTAVNELLEAFLRYRAKDLEKGIRELLGETSAPAKGTPAGQSYLAQLYQHPLVNGLFQGTYGTRGCRLPSYIPARTFALALMDMLVPATPDSPSGTQGAAALGDGIANVAESAAPAPAAPQPGDGPATSEESPATPDAGLTAPAGGGPNNPTGNPATPGGGAPAPTTSPLANFRQGVSGLPDGKLRAAVLALTDAAGTDMAAVRTNIENWYNSSMDRVSGWYKRRTQLFALLLGLAIAGALNADAIALFKSLSNNRALRDSLVAAATDQVRAGQRPASLDSTLTQLEELKLPIGWHNDWPAQTGKSTDWRNANRSLALPGSWQDDKTGWGLKLLGLLVTGIAVSLGSPFWFDILNKLVVVRSTVKPHEKSPEEASDDRQKSSKS